MPGGSAAPFEPNDNRWVFEELALQFRNMQHICVLRNSISDIDIIGVSACQVFLALLQERQGNKSRVFAL